MKVLILGGGNSAHVLIPLLSSAGHQVSLLTSKPEKWNRHIRAEHHNTAGECLKVWDGELSVVSSDPAEVVPDAEAIILCLPVHASRAMLHLIAPFINRKKACILGTLYGQAGFNWMAEEIIKKFKFDNILYFAFGLIPWIARVGTYGKLGITYGSKTVNVAAVSDIKRFDELNQLLLMDFCEKKFGTGAIKLSENFLSLTLSVDNQIIHPTRCYALYRQHKGIWNTLDEVPYFYRDYDEQSALYLRQLDEDFTRIRETVKKRFADLDFRYMLNYLDLEHLSYSSHSANIVKSFTDSPTLSSIKTPVVQKADGRWELNYDHRVFKDDYTYGICIAKWFAEKFAINTPMLDKLLRWLESITGISILDKENNLLKNSPLYTREFYAGLPDCYGLKTVEECLK